MGFDKIIAWMGVAVILTITLSALFLIYNNTVADMHEFYKTDKQVLDLYKTSFSIENASYNGSGSVWVYAKNTGKGDIALQSNRNDACIDVLIDNVWISKGNFSANVTSNAYDSLIWNPKEYLNIIVNQNLATGMHTLTIVECHGLKKTVQFQVTRNQMVYFVPPTEDNLATILRDWTQVNITINATKISTFVFNWNGTNTTVYNDSLVLALNFNNNSAIGETSNYFVDVSKYGNNGSCSGTACPTWNASGRFGGAYTYDGSNDYIQVNDSSSLDGSLTRFTLFAWIYVKNPVDMSYLVSKEKDTGASGSYGLYLDCSAGCKYGFDFWSNSDSNAILSDAVLTANKWTHLAAVWTGTNIRLYVDGVQQSSAPSVTGSTVNNTNYNLTIGVASNYIAPYFNGTIDEVRIYNRSLSAQEIQLLYQSELQKYTSSEWHFYANVTNLSDGTYSYYGWANDTLGNSGQTDSGLTRYVTVNSLQLSFVPPTENNGTIISRIWTEANITIDALRGLNSFRFNWNGTDYSIYDNSLVLDLNFNNNSALGENATRFIDVSRYGNNGICYLASGYCPNFTSTGRFGGGYAFDGVNDYVNLSFVAVHNRNFTVSAWAKMSGPGGGSEKSNTIFLQRNSAMGDNHCEIGIDPEDGGTGGSAQFIVRSSSGTETTLAVASKGYGGWHNYVGVVNGSNMFFYIDGQLNGSQANGQSGDYDIGIDYNAIGKYGYGGGDYGFFNGTIDEVRIYNRSLSAQEIWLQYQSEFQKYNSTEWRFYTNVTNLFPGTYTYYGWANDTNGNAKQTDSGYLRYLTVNSSFIQFVAPTLSNGSTTANTWAEANVTISTSNLDAFKFNWNGANYTIYDNSLVLALNFNNNSGIGENSTYVVDSSKYGVNGNCSGTYCPNWTASGRFGGAYNFDGLDDFFLLGPVNVNLTNQVTVSVWYKPRPSTQIMWTLFENRNAFSAGEYGLYASANGTLGSIMFQAYPIECEAPASYTKFDNSWHHLVGESNGTFIRIFLDGTQIFNCSGAVSAGTQTQAYIGAWNGDRYFNGTIDELRVYSSYLSDQEILVQYESEFQKYSSSEYRFYANVTNLFGGIYTYYGWANTTSGTSGQTDNGNLRYLTVTSFINFMPPTENNGISITRDWTPANITINASNLDTFKFNWNGADYSIYDNSLVLDLNFNNNSAIGENNSFVVDASKYGNNGTIFNASTLVNLSSNCVFGSCLFFNHSALYPYPQGAIQIPSTPSLNAVNGLTLMGWFKIGSDSVFSGFPGLIYKSNIVDQYGLYLDSSSTASSAVLKFDVANASTTQYGTASGIPTNTWVHLAATYTANSSFDPQAMKIYINSVLTTTQWGLNGSINTTTGYMILCDGGNGGYKGYCDEIKVYNRSLSAQEIWLQYKSEFQKYSAAEYRFYSNLTSLSAGTYAYYGWANTTSGTSGQTDSGNPRYIIVNMPQWIYFMSPTLGNASTTINNWTEANITIGTANLDTFGFNWNGTNYTIYNNSLVLDLNFNNNSGIGENYANSNGTKIVDSSKYGNNGTLYVGADGSGNYTTGRFGGAYGYDGVNDYIDLGTPQSLEINNTLTIMGWVKTSDSSKDEMTLIVQSDGTDYRNYQVYFEYGLLDFVHGNGTYSDYVETGINITDGAWHFIAVSVNGKNITIYKDTTRFNTTLTFNITTPSIGSYRVAGVSSSYPKTIFNGTIDEVRVYNRSLSDQEIWLQYQSEFAKYSSSEYRFYVNVTNLSLGTYTYYGWANTTIATSGQTDSGNPRYITVASQALYFTSPTEDNASIITRNWGQANVSINSKSLDTFKFNWNGTNYTIYDKSLVLVLNFNNDSAIGDNSSVYVDSSKYGNNGFAKYGLGDCYADTGSNATQANASDYIWGANYADGYFNGWKVIDVSTGYIRTVIRSNSTGPDWSRYWLLVFNESIPGFGEGSYFYLYNVPTGPSYGTGRFGLGARLDGDDYVEVPDTSTLDFGTGNFTVSFFYSVLNTTYYNYMPLVGKAMGDWGVSDVPGWEFLVDQDMEYYLDFDDSVHNSTTWTSIPNFSFNTWMQATFVVDRTAGKVTIYHNGQNIGQADISIVTGSLSDTYPLDIGRRQWGGYTNGSVDEVRIYNRSLTPSEVWLQYQSEYKKYSSTEYRFYVNLSNLADGNYTYYGWMNDTSGTSSYTINYTSTNPRYLTVDASAPIVSLTAPLNNTGQTSGTAGFIFSVADFSSIQFCNLTINGAINQYIASVPKGVNITFNVSSLANGIYYWNVNCTDAQGLNGNSVVFKFTIDSVAPILNFVSPTTGNATTINVSYTPVNITIDEPNLNTFIFNWAGTNYIIYDSSLILSLGFDNNSALGESYTNSNGAIMVDISGYGNNGSLYVGAAGSGNYTAGKFGGAYSFDGSDDYVRVPYNPVFDSSSSWTVTGWLNLAPTTIKNISSGAYSTCAILSSGMGECWGDNWDGELGDGSYNSSTTPVPVYGGYNFSSIRGGVEHACGLLTNGSAYCWGVNWDGRLGNGLLDDSPIPVAVARGYIFTAIGSTYDSSCGRLANGSVLCWGTNEYGQLGNGVTGPDSNVPVAVRGGYNFTAISLNGYHACGRLNNGSVRCWGLNNHGQLGNGGTTDSNVPVAVLGGYNFTLIYSGGAHSCGLLRNGTAMCWGDDQAAELGDGQWSDSSVPVTVLGQYNNFTALSLGNTHSCGILVNGSAMCWGEGSLIGDGTDSYAPSPGAVAGGYNFTSLSAYFYHTCGIASDGSVVCWGDNQFSEIGDGGTSVRYEPSYVSGDYNYSSLNMQGEAYGSCARLTNGTNYCWGQNLYNQLDNSSATAIGVPQTPQAAYNFVYVRVGRSHACGLLANGSAYCWGADNNGMLGDGGVTDSSVPVAVLGGYTFSSIDVGKYHTCGRLANGSIRCWGWNGEGELGDNTWTSSGVPVALYGGGNYTNISTGAEHTCGRLTNGSVRCWGFNYYGQLGNGGTSDSNIPVNVSGGRNYTSISLGHDYSCGRLVNGSLMCWGSNGGGELGNGDTTYTDSSVPVAASGNLNYTSVTTGYEHTCGILTNGTLMCWGYDDYGQLGDDRAAGWRTSTPILAAGGTFYVAVGAGLYNTCGLLANGSIQCWGGNFYREIGRGGGDALVPRKVSRGLLLGKSSQTYALATSFDNELVAYADQNALRHSMSSSQWHHAAMTYDKAGYFKLYLDGVEVNSSQPKAMIDSETRDLMAGQLMKGIVDEAKVYKRALSAQEIALLYQSQFMKYNTTQYMFYANITNLSGGTYAYYGWANDTAGNSGQTDNGNLRYITVSGTGGSLPVSFVAPTQNNGTSIMTNWTEANVTISTSSLDSFQFNWNGANYSIYGNSLVLAMNFNNNSGIGENSTYVIDVSKYGNNGSTYNGSQICGDQSGCPIHVPGRFGLGMRFDGKDDSVRLGWASSTNLTNNFTLELWFNVSSLHQGNFFGLKDDLLYRGSDYADNVTYLLQVADSTTVQFVKRNVSETLQIYSYTTPNLLNSWNHLCLVYQNNQATLFFNGVSVGTQNVYGIMGTSDASLVIGRIGDLTNDNTTFNGTVDEVRIYNRALSAQEILLQYKSEFAKYSPSEYRFYDNITNLSTGTYTYYGWANNTAGTSGMTDSGNLRYLTVNAGQMIYFMPPTQNNGTSITTNWTEANVTISTSSLDSFQFNWNGANYTIYDNSLVLAYNFNNNSGIGEGYNNSNGSRIVDSSKYGNNGTLYVGANYSGNYTAGRYGGAYNFDGLDDYVNTYTDLSWSTAGSFSIGLWVRPNTVTPVQGLIGKGAAGGYGTSNWEWSLNLNNNVASFVYFNTAGNNGIYLYPASATLVSNRWYYLVVTYDSVNGAKLYQDSVVVATNATPVGTLEDRTTPVLIGHAYFTSNQNYYFNGTIDEVRIYNRSLTAQEILLQYQSEFQKYGSSEYRFYANVTNLSVGAYTYYGWANNTAGVSGMTDSGNPRYITISTVAPMLNFVSPTDSNATTVSRNWTQANITIDTTNLDTFKYNWNGTNYTFYDNSLVLALNFNNNSAIGETSNYYVDVSKYSNNGSCSGTACPAWNASGRLGGASTFDGSNDYIQVNDSNSLDGSLTRFTILAWVYVNKSVDMSYFVSKEKDTGASGSYGLYMDCATGCKYGFDFFSNSDNDYVMADANLTNNTWAHLAGTWDGSNIRLYVNGIQQSSTPAVTGTSVNNTNYNLTIGLAANYAAPYFNGSIDEVRIYNRALSAQEILLHYQSEFTKYNSSQYRFYANVTNLTDGTYTYYGWANNTAGVSGQTDSGYPRYVSVNTFIYFMSPTQANGTSLSRNWTEANITVNTANVDTFKFNWNGTTYTIYDNSLVLALDYDNTTGAGENYNNSNGTFIADLSRYGNNGTLHEDGSNKGNYTAGKYGGAYNYNGLNDYVSVADSQNLSPTDRFTLSAWLKTDTVQIRNISSGWYHTCALLMNGSALCWGGNDYGQLGDGTEIQRLTPVAVAGGYNFSAISAGGYHTCGLLANGSVYCWGYDDDGALGDAGASGWGSDIPVPVSGNYNFTVIDCGLGYTCGRLVNGSVYCWGYNNHGQLGDGSTTSGYVPVALNGVSRNYTAVSAGQYYSCGRLVNGSVYCWGYNNDGELGNGNTSEMHYPVPLGGTSRNYTSVSAGDDHTCGRLVNGTVYCWGLGEDGELGDNQYADSSIPVGIASFNFTSVSCGSEHSCGRLVNGSVYCWGWNEEGELGKGDYYWAYGAPVPVAGGYNFTDINVGELHSCGLLVSGYVLCWGYDSNGQLGDGSASMRTYPVAISGGYNFNYISASSSNTCGLLVNGSAYCWGCNIDGQLGTGSYGESTIPVPVSGGYNFTYVSTGYNFACGRLGNGSAYCWGYNGDGQLGSGSIVYGDTLVPGPVYGNYNFSSISLGDYHTCGRLGNGSIYCWGSNDYGQLGNGNQTTMPYPVPLSGTARNYTSVSGGEYHTCGRLVNGSVYCWGRNSYGQLGNGNTSTMLYPVPLGGTSRNYTSVSGGEYHTCGRLVNGSVYCWGSNDAGQLGDGTHADSNTPVAVAGGYNFTYLDVEGRSSCGLLANGSLLCWGASWDGQFGNGETGDEGSPVWAGTGHTYANFSMGGGHACGQVSNGTVYCWGANGFGELARAGIDRYLPTKIVRGILLGKSSSTYALSSTYDSDIAVFADSNRLGYAPAQGWHHVALTYDKNTSMNLYVDGSLVNTTTPRASLDEEAKNVLTGQLTKGLIDNARIYNRVLNASEITLQYQSNFQKYSSSEYRFYANITNLSTGTYTYYGWANNTAGKSGQTDNGNRYYTKT